MLLKGSTEKVLHLHVFCSICAGELSRPVHLVYLRHGFYPNLLLSAPRDTPIIGLNVNLVFTALVLGVGISF